MNRTPEEIKKGLECGNCKSCPYGEQNGEYHCHEVEFDALAYIQHLEPFKALVEQYIKEHNITCSEDIWQRDTPQIEAIVLADKLCKLVRETNH